MLHSLIIALGGGLGAVLRHWSGQAALRLFGPGFPWGTAFVNVAGSFVMGLFVAWLARKSAMPPELRLFLATGFCGGFTTFSAFSLDAALMYERGQVGLAALYVAASVILSIVALFAGMWIARNLAG